MHCPNGLVFQQQKMLRHGSIFSFYFCQNDQLFFKLKKKPLEIGPEFWKFQKAVKSAIFLREKSHK